MVDTSVGIFASLKRLGLNSGVYVAGNLLNRGLVFLLVPFLTRALTPDDYGIIAVTSTVGSFLVIVLGLGLEVAVTQMYFKYETQDERRSLYGTFLCFWLIVSTLVALGIDFLGQAGVLDIIPHVPFLPYLRIVVWTSYLSIFIALPQTIYMTMEQPLKVVGLATVSSLSTVSLSLYFVVYLGQGIMGSLYATFISAILMAGISIFLTWRMASWRLSISKLKAALVFSLPLVPHTVSQWLLSLSDRFVLAGYVTAGALGIYSLGYQFGALVVLFTGAINNAFSPIVNARLTSEYTRNKVPALGTYALLGIGSVGLGVSLFGEDMLRLLTPSQFHSAGAIIPWVALAYVLHGVYLIWSRGTWFSMKTRWVPVLTMLAGVINITLNLWLVPQWGILAAAFNTVVAYGVLALLHGYLAQKIYPIPWEYVRWVKILLMALVCFFISAALSGENSIYNLMLKVLILCGVFPISLILVGFLTPGERRFLMSLVDRYRVRLVRVLS